MEEACKKCLALALRLVVKNMKKIKLIFCVVIGLLKDYENKTNKINQSIANRIRMLKRTR